MATWGATQSLPKLPIWFGWAVEASETSQCPHFWRSRPFERKAPSSLPPNVLAMGVQSPATAQPGLEPSLGASHLAAKFWLPSLAQHAWIMIHGQRRLPPQQHIISAPNFNDFGVPLHGKTISSLVVEGSQKDTAKRFPGPQAHEFQIYLVLFQTPNL